MQEQFSSNNENGINWRNFACVQHNRGTITAALVTEKPVSSF